MTKELDAAVDRFKRAREEYQNTWEASKAADVESKRIKETYEGADRLRVVGRSIDNAIRAYKVNQTAKTEVVAAEEALMSILRELGYPVSNETQSIDITMNDSGKVVSVDYTQ
jgi:Sec-independent protein translocase protein TatA